MQGIRASLPFLVLLAIWLLLSDAASASLLIGIPTVVAAYWASRKLHTETGKPVSVLGLLRFTPFFLLESMRGGLDVARRVFSPTLDVHPGLKQYRMQLTNQSARVLFTNTVSLLPGTLTADLNDDTLTIHTLDSTTDLDAELRRVEAAVGRVFGEPA